ncbi:type II toxin-antitoxin system VapC family toxin [Christensenellaceae bacterium OttesenSCG-928-L17]|nr:type II toxin-antitoxin system VapC family toxin [Christensenellaceae bacterium OttesenSCG-928-L17]
MKKLRIYLDTSVISHLFADDTPDKMADTIRLWKELAARQYEAYISPVVTAEIQRCAEPKRTQMLERLAQIQYKILDKTDEISELAKEYIKGGVLREKSLDDCLHIATAVVNDCDLIVSWNFKHLVNFKTISKVRVVNAINRYKEIGIVSPTMLVEGEEE